MMIMRFHKLIQSRLLWLVFLGVLITTFVGWGVASSIGGDPALARLERPVVKIDGKNVSFLKVDITRRLLMQEYNQQMTDAQLDELAFNHLGMVAYAENAGIDVPEEFAKQQFAQMFRSEEELKQFRIGLSNSHMGEPDYIRFIQEQLMIQNLQRMLASNVIVPAFEVERWASTETDSYSISFAAITPQVLTEEVVVSEEMLQTYFDENIQSFQLPEERIVRYVTVKTENFADKATGLTDEDALAYYQSRPEVYVRSVTQPATEEGGEATTLQEPIPFVEVKMQILDNLRLEQAKQLAEDTAMSYAVRMTPRRGRAGLSLDVLAETEGLEVGTTAAFSEYGALPALNDSQEVKQAAFKLDMTEFGKLGGPVAVGDDFVVIELAEIIPPRLPELDEVRQRVENTAKMMITFEKLDVRAAEIVSEIQTAVKNGSDFETELKKYDLSAMSPPAYEMRNINPNNPSLPMELIREISAVESGDVVGPVKTRFGTPFVAQLVSRTPQPEAAAEITPNVRQMLSSRIYYPEVFANFLEIEIKPLIETIDPDAPVKESLIEDMAEEEEVEDVA